MLADTIPLYPLYALLFADAGLSEARISGLLLIWTAAGIVAEVPAGALADRFSRRGAIVACGLLQAAGYVVWIVAPSFAGFAAGFVLWGVGGAFSSGALEALVYDAVDALGAAEAYPGVHGAVTAVALGCQLPAAVAATVLFRAGSYALVGWASVGCCVSAALVATRLPDVRTAPAPGTEPPGPGGESSYRAVLRAGLREVGVHRAVRGAVVAVAVLAGLDALEEYFPLLARSWGVPTAAVPLAMVAIPLVGAAGAAAGGTAAQLRARTVAWLVGGAVVVFAGAGLLHRPAGVIGMAVAYGTFQAVLVVADARLQARIDGPERATVTSVAALGTEVAALAVVAVWALGRPVLDAALALAVAAALPRLLGPPAAARSAGPR